MTDHHILTGKHILIVDDEADIVDVMAELIDMCRVDKAYDFDAARLMLTHNRYDAAILDIMGVDGYGLLKIARERGIPALMLTAHALSPAHLYDSVKEGAYAYIPKDHIAEVAAVLADIIEASGKRVRPSGRWFQALEPVFDRRFGDKWKSRDLQEALDTMFVFSREELEKIL